MQGLRKIWRNDKGTWCKPFDSLLYGKPFKVTGEVLEAGEIIFDTEFFKNLFEECKGSMKRKRK